VLTHVLPPWQHNLGALDFRPAPQREALPSPATLAGASISHGPLSVRIVIRRSDAAPLSVQLGRRMGTVYMLSVAVALEPPRALRESNSNEAIDGGSTVNVASCRSAFSNTESRG